MDYFVRPFESDCGGIPLNLSAEIGLIELEVPGIISNHASVRKIF